MLREEYRLSVYENRMLRRMFGCKREEVVGGWRRLLNEELHNLHTSPDIIRVIKSRRMRWVEHVAHMIQMRNGFKSLVRKPKRRRPLRIPRCGWKDDTQMDLRKIGWEGVDWIHLAQDRNQ
jgi:hypothetical protein